ncbi:hypothetical protein ASF70_07465 [Rhizobium sp. Leaf321]|uniref:hypothetical protein n=1 Tax=Rhizobium sp. Leaf321 TaxID=1736335 RepID=UPI0007156210|nr:hypothetical protein [Rhizobium sp. Leaf321]KQQ73641.1 hypothetical protein ASF70_07465 [Rhizobium sp. Leaf321]
MAGPMTETPDASSRSGTTPDEEMFLKTMAELDAEIPDVDQTGITTEQIEKDRNSGILGAINRAISPPRFVEAAGEGVIAAGIETKDFLSGEAWPGDKSLFRQAHEDRYEANKEGGFITSATQSISQMVTGLVGAGKLMKPVKFLQRLRNGGKAGRAAFEITKGAAASAVVLDPHEDRLSDLIESYPSLQNPVTAYLSSDPGDSAAEGRFKNAIESIGLDFALVGAVKVVKLLRAGKQDEALKEIEKLETKEAVSAATQVASPRGITELRSADIRSRFTGPDGKFDQSAAADGIAEDVQKTLDGGGTVQMVIEGKTRDITSVSRGMMMDSQGHRWGAAPIYMPSPGDDARVILKGPASEVPVRGNTVGESPEVPAQGQASSLTAPQRADAENPDLLSPREVDPQAAPREDVTEQVGISQPIGKNGTRELPSDVKEPGTLRVQEITDEQLDDILKGSAADSAAIKQYGSFAAAREAGHQFGNATPLPWQKLRGTTETMTFIRQTANVLKSRYDVAKGGAKMTDARVQGITKELADVFNEDPEVILGQIAEMGRKASQMVPTLEASLRVGNKMFIDADKLASDIRLGNLDAFAGNAEAANAELKARLAAAVDVMANANSMLANSGRALRRARGQFRVRDADLQNIKNLDSAKLAVIMEKAEGDPRKIMMMANRKWSERVMDEASWHLTNGLLWMWPTHLVNTTTNAMMLVARPTEKLFGSAALKLVTKDAARRAELSTVSRQALREYTYTMTSLADGWFSAVEAFKRGDSILAPHNTEYFQGGAQGISAEVLPWKPVKGVWDVVQNAYMSASYRNIVGLPTRSLGAMDEMFKLMRYRAVVQSRAAVDAAERGLNAADTKSFIQRAMDLAIDPDTGRALDAKALRESQMVGFQQDLDYETTIGGSMGRAAISARRTAPVLSLVLPFVKTPVNVLRYGIKLTPGLNLAQKEFRDAIKGKGGVEAKAHATGQMLMGSMFAGLAASMAASGRLTGGGPRDPELRREMMATGWRPYSIVWEDADGKKQYLQWQRFDPAAMAMGIITDIVVERQMHPDKDLEDASGAVVLALAQNLGDRTFLLSLNNAIQAAMEPEKFPAYVARTMASMLPASTLMREHNPDPYIREARGFVDNLIRGVPGLRETLPKVYDVFGQPMERTLALAGTQDTDIVDAEHNRIMLQTEKWIGKPDPEFQGIDLRDVRLENRKSAYETLQELSGQLPGKKPLKHYLAKEIQKSGYQDLPDGEAGEKGTRLNRLASITGSYRDAARAELVRRYPELRPLIKQRQKEARGAFIENRQRRQEGQPGAQELLKALGR